MLAVLRWCGGFGGRPLMDVKDTHNKYSGQARQPIDTTIYYGYK